MKIILSITEMIPFIWAPNLLSLFCRPFGGLFEVMPTRNFDDIYRGQQIKCWRSRENCNFWSSHQKVNMSLKCSSKKDTGLPCLMNEYHLKIVGKSSQDSSMSFEVDISNCNCAVTKEAKFSLHVELLQEDQAVACCIHCASRRQKKFSQGTC